MPNIRRTTRLGPKVSKAKKLQKQALSSIAKSMRQMRVSNSRPVPNVARNTKVVTVKRRQRSSTSPCVISDVERITTVTVNTTAKAGDLLYTIPANPSVCPRLSAIASQFDSWHGNFTFECETTGNAFSQDFALLRYTSNGDPSKIPLSGNTLLNFADVSGRPGQSARLQLDANSKSSVHTLWSKESYNPKKPISDTDPSECNLGYFILVANGSPGSSPVNIVVRLRYKVTFFSPVYSPWVFDTSKKFVAAGSVSSSNIMGLNPVATGNGTETWSGNSLTLPIQQGYTLNYLQVGTGTMTTPTFTASPALANGQTSVNTAYSYNAGTGYTITSWDINPSAPNTVLTFTVSGTTTTSGTFSISPN